MWICITNMYLWGCLYTLTLLSLTLSRKTLSKVSISDILRNDYLDHFHTFGENFDFDYWLKLNFQGSGLAGACIFKTRPITMPMRVVIFFRSCRYFKNMFISSIHSRWPKPMKEVLDATRKSRKVFSQVPPKQDID